MRQRSVTPPPAPTLPPPRRAFLLALLFLAASTVLASLAPPPSRAPDTAEATRPVVTIPVPSVPAPTPGRRQPPGPPLSHAEYERLTRSLGEYLDGQDGRLSIALHDLSTGATYSYGPQESYITASLVKVNILVLLLLQAQDEERELSESERHLAASMIRYSDNDSADALYARIGFDPGFSAGNARLGLHATEPGGGGVWGATRTTTTDQLRLLRTVFTDTGPLSEYSRRYARELLESVAPEQAWGISAAAGEDDTVALKNGWVPRSSDGDRWAITSAGHVTGPEHEYLIAVLSDHHPDYRSGVECVEHVVTEVVAALNGGERA